MCVAGTFLRLSQSDRVVIPVIMETCQIEANRKQDTVEKALRAHDRVARAENQRQLRKGDATSVGGYNADYHSHNLVRGMTFGDGCRCCYDPNGDGGEYELLTKAKQARADAAADTNYHALDNPIEEDEKEFRTSDDDDNSSDSDDEFDYLLDEVASPAGDAASSLGDYAHLQSLRRAELEQQAEHLEVARQHGYGVHRQMHAQRCFAAVGCGVAPSQDRFLPRCACLHLYDAHSPLSVSLDLCLEDMAARYPGTKFARGLGTACLLFANDGGSGIESDRAEWKKKGNGCLPMILALREGRVVSHSSGLRDLQYAGEVEPRAVEQWLDRAGVLLTTPPPRDLLCKIPPEVEMLVQSMRKMSGPGSRSNDGGGFGGMMNLMKGASGQKQGQEDIEEEDRYDCGVSGCSKSFYHEHVGVANEVHGGLLVSESQVESS